MGEGTSIFCLTFTKKGYFKPKSVRLGNHEARMLLLVHLCSLGTKVPFSMDVEPTQTVSGAKQPLVLICTVAFHYANGSQGS